MKAPWLVAVLGILSLGAAALLWMQPPDAFEPRPVSPDSGGADHQVESGLRPPIATVSPPRNSAANEERAAAPMDRRDKLDPGRERSRAAVRVGEQHRQHEERTHERIESPVPLQESHRSIVKRSPPPGGLDFAKLHRELELEGKDDAWSYSKEFQIAGYLESRAAQLKFLVNQVECRTSLCEAQLTAYESPLGPWFQLMRDMSVQPWATDMEKPTFSASWNPERGRLAVIVAIRRRATTGQ